VIVEIGGNRRNVCCAHCALTEGRQEKKPVRFIEVTDFRTGKGLDPQRAWFVDGSRVIACEHDMAKMGEMKQTDQISFDRCSPGTFAFADRKAAEEFVAENGGEVHDLAHLAREIQ
jgi:nitrous oxide reductase accessory protein NosL